MERQTNIGGTEPNESATPTATSKAAEETGKVFPRKAGQAHRYLVSGWRVQMVYCRDRYAHGAHGHRP
jgi:hypothetical protein